MPLSDPHPASSELAYLSTARLGEMLRVGEVSVSELVSALLARIEALDRRGPHLGSIISVELDALEQARRLDAERALGRFRGPLHGIPVVVKDNIETAGGPGATAGSLALAGAPATRDAPVVTRLRDAGAVVLAKANMSEWANFRSRHSTSGWSALGGQTRNPHVLDRSPSGSSSGSAVAVAAGLCVLALGTETDGSIVCPAAVNGVVGVKPTHGLLATSGVVPLAASQDCVGPFARSVLDVALALDVLVHPGSGSGSGRLVRAAAAGSRGLDGERVGVVRAFGEAMHPAAGLVLSSALEALRGWGATVVDPVELPTAGELAGFADELVVLEHELHDGLDRYLAGREAGSGRCPRSLAELVAFNDAHASTELALFGQDLLVDAAATGGLDSPVYLGAFARNRARARERGLDTAFAAAGVSVLVMLTTGPASPVDQVNGDPSTSVSSSPAAVAGYPTLSLPIGDVGGLPVGLSLVARPGREDDLVRVAAGVERACSVVLRPAFLATVPLG